MVDENELNDVLFMQLILGLQSSAWMLLGKVANPITGKEERNLEAAKATIDTLLMLKDKTKGNLSKNEDDLLSNILQQLQLNYVDEASKKIETDSGGEEINSEKKGNVSKEKSTPKKSIKKKSKRKKRKS
jgi:hypothetical protein